jgi:tetratricopeptide (TPR) repeat protein
MPGPSQIGWVVSVWVLLAPSCAVLADGSYHDVLKRLNQLLESAPDDPSLHFQLAVAHVDHGDWAACIAEVERVERLAPGKHPTRLLEGRAFSLGGDHQMALYALDDVLQEDPRHAQALAERGKVYLKLKDPVHAMQDYRAAFAAGNPCPRQWFLDAATGLTALGLPDQAVDVFEEGLRRCGADPDFLVQQLDAAVSAQCYETALRNADLLKDFWPRPEPWMARRAQILRQAGRANEARAAWTALHDHLMALPNLDRGLPLLIPILAEVRQALGLNVPAPVIAPPASDASAASPSPNPTDRS